MEDIVWVLTLHYGFLSCTLIFLLHSRIITFGLLSGTIYYLHDILYTYYTMDTIYIYTWWGHEALAIWSARFRPVRCPSFRSLSEITCQAARLSQNPGCNCQWRQRDLLINFLPSGACFPFILSSFLCLPHRRYLRKNRLVSKSERKRQRRFVL